MFWGDPFGIDSTKVDGQTTDVLCIFNCSMDVLWMFYGCILSIVNALCIRWAFHGHSIDNGHSLYVVRAFYGYSVGIRCMLYVRNFC